MCGCACAALTIVIIGGAGFILGVIVGIVLLVKGVKSGRVEIQED